MSARTRRAPGLASPALAETVSTTTYSPQDTPRRGRVNDDPAIVGITAWMKQRIGSPGDAAERLADRRVRDVVFLGLPELVRPEWAA